MPDCSTENGSRSGLKFQIDAKIFRWGPGSVNQIRQIGVINRGRRSAGAGSAKLGKKYVVISGNLPNEDRKHKTRTQTEARLKV